VNIVICGSLKFKEDIIKIGDKLESMGINAKLPIECINSEPKEVASRAHFNRIIDKTTDAILVVNKDKGEIKNYIGPNTFAEIAFAYYYNKKVVLLNGIYEPYKDELEAWKVITLKGNLENIKKW